MQELDLKQRVVSIAKSITYYSWTTGTIGEFLAQSGSLEYSVFLGFLEIPPSFQPNPDGMTPLYCIIAISS